jgi:hypothetical protein
VGGVGHDLRAPRAGHRGVAAEQVLDRRRRDQRARPEGVRRDAAVAELLAMPSATMLIPYLAMVYATCCENQAG